MVSAEDAEIRRRVLTKLENEQGLTLKRLAEESRVAHIKKIKRKPTLYSLQKEKSKITRLNVYDKQSTNRRENPPPAPGYICGDLHWMRFCPAKKKKTCKNCGKVGHEVTLCWSAKKIEETQK